MGRFWDYRSLDQVASTFRARLIEGAVLYPLNMEMLIYCHKRLPASCFCFSKDLLLWEKRMESC